MNQARALGESWYSTLHTPIHRIYASDLKRAHSTALQLAAPRAALPDAHPLHCPPPHVSPLIREQHFGIAEGNPWSAGPVAQTHDDDGQGQGKGKGQGQGQEREREVYETIRNRHDKFAGGESLDDLAQRAEDALETLLWPHLDDARTHCDCANRTAPHAGDADADTDADARRQDAAAAAAADVLGYHVVFVSHGLCISELVAAILRRSANAGTGATVGLRFRGLVNTGWTRLHIRPLVSD